MSAWLRDPWSSDPWRAFEDMRRELAGTFQRWGEVAASPRQRGVAPPVNLYESSDAYVLTAEVPGLEAKDIELSLEANRVTLRGERRVEYPESGVSLHRLERRSGIFRRTVELPEDVDADKAEAVCRHGVLMIRFPKKPEKQPRRIAVQTE
jgi:HSP20 family protein